MLLALALLAQAGDLPACPEVLPEPIEMISPRMGWHWESGIDLPVTVDAVFDVTEVGETANITTDAPTRLIEISIIRPERLRFPDQPACRGGRFTFILDADEPSP